MRGFGFCQFIRYVEMIQGSNNSGSVTSHFDMLFSILELNKQT